MRKLPVVRILTDIKQEEVDKIRLLKAEYILSEEGKKTIEQILEILDQIRGVSNNILAYHKGLFGETSEAETLLEGHRDWLSRLNTDLIKVSSPLFNRVKEEGHFLKEMSDSASNLKMLIRDVDNHVAMGRRTVKLGYGKGVFNQLIKLKKEEHIQFRQISINIKIITLMHWYFEKADVRMVLYYLKSYENNEIHFGEPPYMQLQNIVERIDGWTGNYSLIKVFNRLKELTEKLEKYLSMEMREEKEVLGLEREISDELSNIQKLRPNKHLI